MDSCVTTYPSSFRRVKFFAVSFTRLLSTLLPSSKCPALKNVGNGTGSEFLTALQIA